MIFEGLISIWTIELFFKICNAWTITEAKWIFVRKEILCLCISAYSFKVGKGRYYMMRYSLYGDLSFITLKYSGMKIDGVPLNFDVIFISWAIRFREDSPDGNLFDLKTRNFLCCFLTLFGVTIPWFSFVRSSILTALLLLALSMYQN